MKPASLPQALVLSAATVPVLTAISCDEAPERRPNVIFIPMDDAGYGDFGCVCQWQALCYYPPFLRDRRLYLDNRLLPPGR